MKRRIAVILATLTAMLSLAAPASAAPTYDIDDCSQGQLCLFDTKLVLPDFHRYIINDRPSGTCFDIPVDWDNRANIVNNRTVHSVTFYTGNSCNGALRPYPILPGTRANFNCCDNGDEANSVLFQGGSGCFAEAPCLTHVSLTARVDNPPARYDRCNQGEVCVFGETNGAGTIWRFYNTISGICINITGAANDRGMSFYNRRGLNTPSTSDDRHISFYEHAGCQGRNLNPGNLDAPIPSNGHTNFYCPQHPPYSQPCDQRRASSIFYHNG